MWQDVVDLHDFYQTPLGGVTRRLLLARIRARYYCPTEPRKLRSAVSNCPGL